MHRLDPALNGLCDVSGLGLGRPTGNEHVMACSAQTPPPPPPSLLPFLDNNSYAAQLQGAWCAAVVLG